MSRRRLLAVPLALALLLPACGGNDEDAVRDTIKTYFAAVTAGDGETACAQLAQRYRDEVGDGQDCVAFFDAKPVSAQAQVLRNENAATDSEIAFDGGTATVTGPGGENITLLEEDGEWRLSGR